MNVRVHTHAWITDLPTWGCACMSCLLYACKGKEAISSGGGKQHLPFKGSQQRTDGRWHNREPAEMKRERWQLVRLCHGGDSASALPPAAIPCSLPFGLPLAALLR